VKGLVKKTKICTPFKQARIPNHYGSLQVFTAWVKIIDLGVKQGLCRIKPVCNRYAA